MSNNLDKEKVLAKGFKVERASLYGRIDKYDMAETEDRIHEFGHLIPHQFRMSCKRIKETLS